MAVYNTDEHLTPVLLSAMYTCFMSRLLVLVLVLVSTELVLVLLQLVLTTTLVLRLLCVSEICQYVCSTDKLEFVLH